MANVRKDLKRLQNGLKTKNKTLNQLQPGKVWRACGNMPRGCCLDSHFNECFKSFCWFKLF